jgi:hypothetical protein
MGRKYFEQVNILDYLVINRYFQLMTDASPFRLFTCVLVALVISPIASGQNSPEPWFTQQPTLQTVNWGDDATLKCTATGAPNIVYQWMKNGVPIPNTNSNTLVVPNVQPVDQGTYTVSITAGPYTYTSYAAPLVIVGGTGWQWATRVGGAENDSALGLAVAINGLWSSGEYNGQFFRRYSKTTGARLNDFPITTNGDGAAAIALDGGGNLFVGANLEITTPTYSRPGLLQKRKTDGTLVWSRTFGTEKGGTETPNGYAEALAVVPDGAGNVLVGGYYQGRGKFGTIYGGTVGNEGMRGFVAKYDTAGNVLWMRDMNSDGDADDCYVRDVVVDGLGDVYVCGSLGLNGRIQRSGTAGDRTASLGNTYRRPFLVKYNSAGTLVWSYLPDQLGSFLGAEVDALGGIWATGYIGSDEDITSRSGLLAKLNRVNGSVVESVVVPDVTGCVIRTEGLSAFWLAMDASGASVINGVKWGTSCYRCLNFGSLTIDLENLAWEVPVFGGLGARSDEADARVAPDGTVSLALNFTASSFSNRILFPRRGVFSQAGRGRDGFIAQIGELPTITTQPQAILVPKGSLSHIGVTPGGSLASSVRWYQNEKLVPYETQSQLWWEKMQLAHAGWYKARVTKGSSWVDSYSVEVGVVDLAMKNVTLPHRKKLTLAVSAAGTNLSFQWLKNGNPLNSDIRVTGVTTRTLVINDLVPPDAASYSCRVTGPGGTLTTNASIVTVVLPPVVSDFTFDPAMISAGYDFLPPVLNAATKYTITGLPAGMTYSTSTGRITGRPTVTGSFTITITATNLAGTSTRTRLLTVAALPVGVIGSHIGSIAVASPATGTFGLGGRWSASITSTGGVTGTLRVGADVLPFSGAVQVNASAPYQPRLSFTLNRTGGRAPLAMLIHLAENNTSAGTVTEQGGAVANAQGWRKRAALVGIPGLYNFGVLPSVMPLTPRGHGYGTFRIITDGSLTVTGRLADDLPFTTAGFVGPNGEVLVYQQLQPNLQGVVTGVLDIVEYGAFAAAEHDLAGTLHWARAAVTHSRFAPAGFAAVPCVVDGGKYFFRTGPVMDLPATANNARIRAYGGGLPTVAELVFTITPANVAVPPTGNAFGLAVTITPTTGMFSASFKLSDPDPYLPGAMLVRTVAMKGVIRRDAFGNQRGCGFFILPQLPDAMANPPTTINTSSMISGTAELSP